MDVITEDTYEVALNKSVVRYNLPLHIGLYVYQYAKLRILQFYYDFVDRYVDRSLFHYCEMDTDSACIALAGESIEISSHQSIASIASNTDRNGCRLNVVTSIRVTTSIPDSLDAHGRTEPCCLARKAFDKRTPGLFKVGLCGDDFIVLCSKTYYCFGATNKCTTKGLNKRQNNIDKDAFLE